MYRAYLRDFWLFVKKIAPNALAIFLVLLLSAVFLHSVCVWPGATLLDCFVNAFHLMTIERVELTRPWYAQILIFLLPLLGLVFAAQGIVSAFILFLHKSLRQGEWAAVVSSTYKGHTVICGLGQLGDVLCRGLREAGKKVVAIELNQDLASVVTAQRAGVPVIVGDMTSPEALAEANVKEARCVVVCSGDDLANLETAVVAKEMNPDTAVYARVYKKSLADRISEALRFDITTFSPYSAAAERILEQLNRESAAPSS